MNKLREIDIRLAIMKLDIKPVNKLVLLATLIRIDWTTWQSEISSNEIAKTLNHNRRSVVRALTELKELNYLTRSSSKVEAERNSKALTRINISLILNSDDMSHSDEMSHSDDMSHSDEMTLPLVTTCHYTSDEMTLMNSDDMSHNTTNIQSNNNNNNYEESDEMSHSDEMSLPKAEKLLRLELNQIKTIELQLRRNNLSDTLDNRRMIARRIFRIELKKGGYYEQL